MNVPKGSPFVLLSLTVPISMVGTTVIVRQDIERMAMSVQV